MTALVCCRKEIASGNGAAGDFYACRNSLCDENKTVYSQCKANALGLPGGDIPLEIAEICAAFLLLSLSFSHIMRERKRKLRCAEMTMNAENIDVEYKRQYIKDLRKDIVAFANTEGGKLYLGIGDDGEVIGTDDPDDVMLRIAGSLKDSIAPDIMPFLQIRAESMQDKIVIVVETAVGSARPYYLREKGLKPSGVYVRRGSASQPLSEDGIRAMIVQAYGESYEECRSLNQDLTFRAFEREMKASHLDHGDVQLRTLKMIGEDGLYTNLALLLSDQCEHTLKIAVFQGKDDAVFRDRRDYSGSLLAQLQESYAFLDKTVPVRATIDGLRRKDKRDYPLSAVREALLNAMVHRDYSFTGSTLINIYEDRIEFVSLGGLVQGLSMEAVLMGVSQSRNPQLANVFYRLQLVESYGTGIKRIKALYRGNPHQPVFESAPGAFKTTLYNLNLAGTLSVATTGSMGENEKGKIHDLALYQGKITRRDVEKLLSIGSTKAYALLLQLCDEGVLKVNKAGRNTYYFPE